jgi:hypothetical protein
VTDFKALIRAPADAGLIQVKRAAGRPKDFEAIAELEAILEERRRGEGR